MILNFAEKSNEASGNRSDIDELRRLLAESRADIAAGRTHSHEEVIDNLRRKFTIENSGAYAAKTLPLKP